MTCIRHLLTPPPPPPPFSNNLVSPLWASHFPRERTLSFRVYTARLAWCPVAAAKTGCHLAARRPPGLMLQHKSRSSGDADGGGGGSGSCSGGAWWPSHNPTNNADAGTGPAAPATCSRTAPTALAAPAAARCGCFGCGGCAAAGSTAAPYSAPPRGPGVVQQRRQLWWVAVVAVLVAAAWHTATLAELAVAVVATSLAGGGR